MSAKVIAEARALPRYKRGNRLFVAIADPTDLKALDSVPLPPCPAKRWSLKRTSSPKYLSSEGGEQSLGDLEDNDLNI